ncbi:MAG: chorismate mutase [Alphaproteobacteria bacterium]
MTNAQTRAYPGKMPEKREAGRAQRVEPCRTMADVRCHIDRIDREIVALLAEREGYVRQAARIKPGREDIVDRSRIEEVIGKVRGYAQEQGLEPDLVDAVYRLMIDRFIALETAEFDRLRDASGDGVDPYPG